MGTMNRISSRVCTKALWFGRIGGRNEEIAIRASIIRQGGWSQAREMHGFGRIGIGNSAVGRFRTSDFVIGGAKVGRQQPWLQHREMHRFGRIGIGNKIASNYFRGSDLFGRCQPLQQRAMDRRNRSFVFGSSKMMGNSLAGGKLMQTRALLLCGVNGQEPPPDLNELNTMKIRMRSLARQDSRPELLMCGNEVEILNDGAQCFPALYDGIENAKSEILFEMYWFDSDKAGWSIVNRLIAASQRGVKVTLIYDSFGSIDSDPAMFQKMRDAGCEVLEYNPIPFWRIRYHVDRLIRRDHRKMIVIDRTTCFTGGMNIGNFWLPKSEGGEGWRDVMVRITGPVVPAYVGIFERLANQMRRGFDDRGPLLSEKLSIFSILFSRGRSRWSEFHDQVMASMEKGKDVLSTSFLRRLQSLPENNLVLFPFKVEPHNPASLNPSSAWWSSQGRLQLGLGKKPPKDQRPKTKRDLLIENVQSKWQKLGSNVQIITNDAFSERNTIRRGYIRAINAAKSSIIIVNSYFVPCRSIRKALYKATERGVNVKIIVPSAKTDMHSVRWASHAMYDRMLQRGIQVFEFTPTVLHSKLCVIDSEVATVGTYNMDYRSWLYNLEIITVIHDQAVAKEFERIMLQDIETNCNKVELTTWSTRSLLKRLSEKFFYAFRHHM